MRTPIINTSVMRLKIHRSIIMLRVTSYFEFHISLDNTIVSSDLSITVHCTGTCQSIIQRSWVSEKPEIKRPSHWLQHYRGLSRPTPSTYLKPCFNFLEPLCGASCESVNMAWPQVASDLPSAIGLNSVRCEGALYVTVSFFFSLVSECTTLHSLGQAMDMSR